MQEYTLADVAAHSKREDLWIVIHGKVYDVSKYVPDHPGGVDVLIEVAGTDATAAYNEAGHSEDADEVLETLQIGTIQGYVQTGKPAKTVRLVQKPVEETKSTKSSSSAIGILTMAAIPLAGGLGLSLLTSDKRLNIPAALTNLSHLPQLSSHWLQAVHLPQGGFANGFIAASLFCATVGGVIGSQLSKFTEIESGFTKYPPHIKSKNRIKPNPNLARGWLEPKSYKDLPLIRKDVLSPNVFLFVFQLPKPSDVIGIPIGQHVAIKAAIDGADVSRSYTPVSNNTDLGKLELVIKCYPDGQLTGKYLANLKVGDKVLFRGPKGPMRYRKGLCKKIGMIAGGTGITPMYQLIRAICEDDTDTTEISLIYANRTEDDILLRKELDTFAKNYPKNLKIWYMLDQPPQKWPYGKGFVTQTVMSSKLPKASPDTKVMLCGPPGMVNASQKALVAMGFEAPGAVAKITDQIFLF
ncbi:cytochrome-b5 reductase [Trichoderma gamsii]|uniref:Cytochrome-b5 reductase n=1 Tax=Trichoderma gamsii TaxID=398673 RepID=A0A2P4ZK09_9HYPO|nr:cytochrome-b5 reductase [Trichoderma gamsii]PON24626.1 cytochrome-b5 reductase [Trichoderma gamsii]